jgi:general secretion pathway protein C
MSADRSLISRFADLQNSSEMSAYTARVSAILKKIPLYQWQFGLRLLLVVCLSVSLARLFWLILPVPKIPAAAVAIPAIVSTSADGQSVNIAELKAFPIFGKVEVAPPKVQEAPSPTSEVTVTRLNLILMGIVNSSEEKGSRAIIASGDKQDVYAEEQALPVGAGVTLSKVFADHVIINNNGQFESLWLYQKDPNAPLISQSQITPVAPPPARTSNATDYRDSIPTRPNVDQGPVQGVDPVPADVGKSLSDVLAMSIYREGGQVIGYKIRPGRDIERFKSYGLQADDIVTAVNGMPLNNPNKIMEIYRNMGNATSASLEIKRAGSVITVDVVLQ